MCGRTVAECMDGMDELGLSEEMLEVGLGEGTGHRSKRTACVKTSRGGEGVEVKGEEIDSG